MSGTTPGDNADSDPQQDPYGQPRGERPPSWGERQPSSSWEPGYPAGQEGAAIQLPRPLSIAVKLMYVGAAIYGINLLLLLLSGGELRDELRQAAESVDQDVPAEEIDGLVNATYGSLVAALAIGVLLWVWMAWANRRGRLWARIVATILGGINIIFTLFTLTGAITLSSLIALATVVIAAVALYFMYRPESTAYYRAMSARAF